jgi:hypothetical protein
MVVPCKGKPGMRGIRSRKGSEQEHLNGKK